MLVDEDVEDWVDETVEVHEHGNLLEDTRLHHSHHEDDRIGPHAEQEGQGDGTHDDGHTSLTTK